MNRKEFVRNSCYACLALTGVGMMMSSCTTNRYVTGKLNRDGLLLDLEEFKFENNEKNEFRSFVIVKNDELKFPICVYRTNENEYSALWMQCAHQGAELQVAGKFLQCPAHGSEFDQQGNVTNGPAQKNLRSFPVTVQHKQLFIDLRKK